MAKLAQCLNQQQTNLRLSGILKILKNISTAIAPLREKRNVYCTNRHFKCVETWKILKTITTSGKLNCYNKYHNLVRLVAENTGLHVNTAYTRIAWMQEAGFLTRDEKNNLILTSYDKVCEIYGIKKEFYEINTTETDKLGRMEYLLKTLVFEENKMRQRYSVEKNYKNNPTLTTAFAQLEAKCGNNLQELFSHIAYYQVKTFEGSNNYNIAASFPLIPTKHIYDFVHTLRVDTNPTNLSISRMFGCSPQTAVDHKRALKKRKFVALKERRHESKNCTHLPRNVNTGKLIPLQFDYDQKRHRRIWVQATEITTILSGSL